MTVSTFISIILFIKSHCWRITWMGCDLTQNMVIQEWQLMATLGQSWHLLLKHIRYSITGYLLCHLKGVNVFWIEMKSENKKRNGIDAMKVEVQNFIMMSGYESHSFASYMVFTLCCCPLCYPSCQVHHRCWRSCCDVRVLMCASCWGLMRDQKEKLFYIGHSRGHDYSQRPWFSKIAPKE